MELETVQIPWPNAKGYKIVNADDPRAQKPKRGRPKKEAQDE